MLRFVRPAFIIVVGLLAWESFPGDSLLFARANEDEKKIDTISRTIDTAYIVGVAGIVLVAIGLLAMVFGRKKKARNEAKQTARRAPDPRPHSTEDGHTEK